MRRRLVPVALVAVTLVELLGSAAAAQDATPGLGAQELPVTADPAGCQVEPRSTDELLALVEVAATPAAAPATPDAVARAVVPLGEPADEATTAGVTATVREVFDCFAAGDFRRVLALFSEGGVVRFFRPAPAEEVDVEEIRDLLEATPEPVPSEQRGRLLAVASVSVLPGERVGAFVVVDDPTAPVEGPTVVYVLFVARGDRWLVDDFVEFTPAGGQGEMPGTPVA